MASNNPILANITEYLIEEASAEEEELLGKNNDLEDGEEGEDGNSVTRDDDLLKVMIYSNKKWKFSRVTRHDVIIQCKLFTINFRYWIDCCSTCE